MPIEVRQQAIIVRLVYIVELCVAEGLVYSSGRKLVVWGRASDEREGEEERTSGVWKDRSTNQARAKYNTYVVLQIPVHGLDPCHRI
jgi:hypothetical protein